MTNIPKITFLGEPGIDDGGPKKEFFQLVSAEIGRNNSLFCGSPTRRTPIHNVFALQDKLFYYVGQILGLSPMHDGPGIQCLSPTVSWYLLGEATHLDMKDIPEMGMEQKLRKVCSTCT